MNDETPRDIPSALVIPFGKHKGKTVAELMVRDPGYVEWVTSQGWMAQRFAELHAALVTGGAAPDDTPEHNALQARFLDADFQSAFLDRALGRDRIRLNRLVSAYYDYINSKMAAGRHSWEALRPVVRSDNVLRQIAALGIGEPELRPDRFHLFTSVSFEQGGVDVVLCWDFAQSRDGALINDPDGGIKIELKPSVGDDYPSVLRQMRRLNSGTLVLEQYTGRGVSEPQFRQILETSGIRVLFLQEIEEAMRSPTPSRSGERG